MGAGRPGRRCRSDGRVNSAGGKGAERVHQGDTEDEGVQARVKEPKGPWSIQLLHENRDRRENRGA